MEKMLKDLRETIEYLTTLMLGTLANDVVFSSIISKLIKLCFVEELLKEYRETGIEAFKSV